MCCLSPTDKRENCVAIRVLLAISEFTNSVRMSIWVVHHITTKHPLKVSFGVWICGCGYTLVFLTVTTLNYRGGLVLILFIYQLLIYLQQCTTVY